MKLIKQFAKGILRQLPNEGRTLKSAIHKLRMKSDIAKSGLSRHLGGAILPHPQTVFWIDPSRIEFHTSRETASDDWEDWVFDQKAKITRVQGGDWDFLSHRVAEMRICRAIDERIHHGTAWSSTDYYKYAVHKIENGQVLWDCPDRAAFDRRCDAVDKLIESISKHGYSEGAAITTSNGQSFEKYCEIVINLSREGLPLFQDGRHRLAIARVLGLNHVPVQVLVRHSEWQTFREFMHRMARGEGGSSRTGVLYQPPIHFDLSDIPYAHMCEDRWDAIKSHLDNGPGTVLDIGCNLGFFGHRFEEIGYTYIGVEYFPDIAMAAQKIAVAEGHNFRVLNADILVSSTLQEIGTVEFDVVIATSIFHHFIKSEADYNSLRQFLGKIKIGTMFFEPHLPDDPQMQGVFANPDPNEFVGLIQEWSNLKTCTPIYTATDGRTVFKLDH
jgi:SAM-dependent methyltransferase